MSKIHMGLVRGGMGACFGQELFLFFLLVLPINFLAKIFCANLLGLAPGGKHDDDDDDDTGIPPTELYKKDERRGTCLDHSILFSANIELI